MVTADGHATGRVGVGVLVVGGAYALTLTVADASTAVLVAGPPPPDVIERLPVRIAGGLLLGTTLSLLAARMPGSRRRHVLVWWLLVYLSTVGVVIEGRVFAPDLVPLASVPRDLATHAVVALVVTASLAFVCVPARTRGPTVPDLPDVRRLLVGLLAGTVTYAVLYFVVGALNYALVTGPYYERGVEGLVNPPVRGVAVVALVRGVLLSVSLVPLVRSVESPRQRAWMAALAVGVLAGLLPLLTQVGRLPAIVLVASSYEIVLQVCPTAVVVAALLGKGAAPSLRTELARMWRGRSLP